MMISSKCINIEGRLFVADWNKIKAEYIAGGTSYRKLCEKYGLKLSELRSAAEREKWVELKAQAQHKTNTKLVNAVSNKNARIDDKYFKLVDMLLDKAEELILTTPIWQPTGLKELATTMKYLKECKGVKSEADMREQEARIKKLEKEAQIGADEDDEGTGVLMLPEADAPLIDKEDGGE
jgi:hypothetical protein